MMAFVTLEDFTGKGECIVFSDAYQKYSRILQPESMVMAIGKGKMSGDALKILVNEVVPLEQVREKFTKSIFLNLNLDTIDENTVVELRRVIERHQGKCMCYFNVTGGGRSKNSVYLTRMYSVEPSVQFITAVRQLLGSSAVQLQG